jgi:hypothetical protein
MLAHAASVAATTLSKCTPTVWSIRGMAVSPRT